MRTIALLAVLALAASRSGVAQAPTDQAMQAAAVLRAPTLAPSASLSAADNLQPRKFSSRAPGATLMIVGGACLLAGILVGGNGGTVLILAGIGIGAYGIYLYTQ